MSACEDGPATPLTVAQRRARFAAQAAEALAGQLGVGADARLPARSGRSDRYVWFSEDDALTLVVGDQEGDDADSALAIGLAERGERRLRLVLPHGWHEPTLHRWPWLRDGLPLDVWTHANGTATPASPPSREMSKRLVSSVEDPALHLGARTEWVEELMRWAGEQPDLDPAHRRGFRAWQCRGQRVLLIQPSRKGLTIVAGIDWGAGSPHKGPDPRDPITGPLTEAELTDLQALVREGCRQRLSGVARKADEHWLQAELRRFPQTLGLEQPVLRELPAWRPRGSLAGKAQPRGRGYVDLAGLDATGALILVETKLGGDDMLVLQGLDYLIWAEANRERLTARLDCRRDVPFEVAYCVGGKEAGAPSWSRHAAAQLQALAPDLRWHVQKVIGWFDGQLKIDRGALRAVPLYEAA